MDPHAEIGLHQEVSIAELLVLGGLARDPSHGISLIGHGAVAIEHWTIGISQCTLPRWILRGVTITSGERSMRISDDGTRILRKREQSLA